MSWDWDVVYGENTDCTAKRHGNPNTPIQEGHENGSSCYLVRVSRVCCSYETGGIMENSNRNLCYHFCTDRLPYFLTHSCVESAYNLISCVLHLVCTRVCIVVP